jgi:hypothetical protein
MVFEFCVEEWRPFHIKLAILTLLIVCGKIICHSFNSGAYIGDIQEFWYSDYSKIRKWN